jgi:gas vesicle protein
MKDVMSNQQSNNGGGGVLLAFLAGAAVGAAVALLFAPATGSETREAVNRRAREGRDRVLDALKQGQGIVAAQREGIGKAFDRARERAQAGVRDPEPDA